MKLSDTTSRKFIESFDISDWEIESNTGWEDVSAIHKTIEYEVYRIELENGLFLECADDHILIQSNLSEVYAKDSLDKLLITNIGISRVISVTLLDYSENMYDVTVNSDNHSFYSNGILSHNTTSATVIILHYVLFNEAKRVALLANNASGSREILERIKLAYEGLPRFLQCGVSEWNKSSVQFENKSKIVAAASSSSSIRGRTVSMLYIDETSFIPRWDLFSASVLPTLSSGLTTKTILTSTPNGMNHFYYYCKGAREGTNGFKYFEVPWYKVPSRDEKWKQETLETINFDMDKFRVEYECQFAGSVGSLISGGVLQTLKPVEPIRKSEGLSQYEDPIKDGIYFLTSDVARGKGLDYSTVQVLRLTDDRKYRQVATYNSNTVTPIEFAGVVNNLGRLYNSCPVLVELNDIGGQILDLLLIDYEYENLIYTESKGPKGKGIVFGKTKSSDLGVRTTTSVKSIGCSILKVLIEQEKLEINDKTTIDQLRVFSKYLNTYRAEYGHHDDLVMPLVLFAWMSADQNFVGYTDSNILMDLRENSESELFDNLELFGFYNDGTESPEEVKEFFSGDLWQQVMPTDRNW